LIVVRGFRLHDARGTCSLHITGIGHCRGIGL
jgi:hypothetical protein